MTKSALTIAAILLFAINLRAQDRQDYRVPRAAEPPKIDGSLDDDVWQQGAMPLGEWVSYNPLRGDKMSADFRTDVRMAYDDRNIYFAIHCFDKEPDKIRTTISRRDNAFNDDWIAMSLDSAGTGQTAYHLFVNPSGIQMDALNTSASGEQFDADLVWYSVGKVTNDGYIVEIRLPLTTVRFSGGADVRMGLLFFRKISRMGVSYSWPAMPPGQWVFDAPGHILFSDLRQPQLAEFLPSVTYGVNQERDTPDRWKPAEDKTNLGISGKLGITSNVTLDGTINPDFSQVESDAFQVQVNQRFPTFYSEKRPFFMEGMGLFNIAGTNGDGNMRTAVHTRRIIDPSWGSKLTGTAGKTTFGLLNASDESPEDIGNRGGAIADRGKFFTVARATYALRRSDYVGAIITDTNHYGRHNQVVGGDVAIKFSPPQEFSATFLTSRTAVSSADTHGTASQVSYSYNTRRFGWSNQVEHYGRDFQMDTAFYNDRTGFTSGWSFGEVNFYPTATSSWLRRVHPYYWTKRGRDRVQNGDEDYLTTGIRFNFTRQGYLQIARGQGHEPFLGQRYKTGGGANLYGNVQILRWLNISGNFNNGRAIYYDDGVNPFQGESRNAGVGMTLQPNQHVNQSIDVNTVRFDRASTGEKVFSLTIVNSKTTYQFDKHFLVRLLEQFDSLRHQLLTDLLASYEFVPGTVFHAGYGSLYEKQVAQPAALVSGTVDGNYLTVNRGLFFKVSYLHRF